jgi:hypothetical protein
MRSENALLVEEQSFSEFALLRWRTAQDGPRSSYGPHPNTLALDRPSSLLGKAASAGGPDSAFQRRGSSEISYFWSGLRPGLEEICQKERRERLDARFFSGQTCRLGEGFGWYCDQNICKSYMALNEPSSVAIAFMGPIKIFLFAWK